MTFMGAPLRRHTAFNIHTETKDHSLYCDCQMQEPTLHSPILAPLIALVLWTFVMWAWMYATRIPAIRKKRIALDPQRTKEEFNAQLPAEVRWKADNYNHLLEQPTLFYAVALTLAFLDAGGGLTAFWHGSMSGLGLLTASFRRLSIPLSFVLLSLWAPRSSSSF